MPRKAITKERLIAMLADQNDLSKQASREMLNDLISMITKHLRQGERVKVAGLGILLVRDRPARMGRNPRTGEAVEIKAGKKVAFRIAKKLKIGNLVRLPKEPDRVDPVPRVGAVSRVPDPPELLGVFKTDTQHGSLCNPYETNELVPIHFSL